MQNIQQAASIAPVRGHNLQLIRWLTFLMFTLFAMTTDAVGVIIPQIIQEFQLTLTQASAFHYAPMMAIAISGIGLGFLADKFGRKSTIILGLGLFTLACFLFSQGQAFGFFILLLLISGGAIGIFKTAALALIGDISTNTSAHTRTMNTAEGFFGLGAMIGPAIVAYLLAHEVSWTYLYMIAGALSLILIAIAASVNYPEHHPVSSDSPDSASISKSLAMLKEPFALGFSLAIALYVATEVAIYVWMPSFLADYTGSYLWLSAYALTVFFVLRAGGRFLGSWVLTRYHWSSVMLVFSGAIFLCFLLSALLGVNAALFLLPVSGLFMSMIYPTLNSKGISCFPKHQHSTIAGVILFFTAAAAAFGPLLMGAIGDIFGHVRFGFYLATGYAGLLFLAMIYNRIANPAEARLAAQDE